VLERATVVTATLLLLAGTAGCTGDGGAADTTTVDTVPPAAGSTSPATAGTTTTVSGSTTSTSLPVDHGELGALDGALAADGTLDVDAALRLFAAGYAPVPDVERARTAPIDGGPVLRTLLAEADELRDEQRALVARTVAPPGQPLGEVLSDEGANPRLRAAARTVRAAIESFGGERGRPLSDDVTVTFLILPYENDDGTHNFSSLKSIATAIPFGDGARPYAECRIRVNADRPLDRRDGFADPAFVSSVAHEAFHCLQYEVLPFTAGAPQWAVEGAAAFAGEDFAGGSPVSANWWKRWIEQPQRPLDRRTYDAIGFFSLLSGSTNPYAFADALLTDPSADSVRRRLEGSDVFDRWGLEYATQPRWGAIYRITGPGAPPARHAPRTPLRLRIDRPAVVAGGSTVSERLAAAPLLIKIPGDVLVVTADPGDRGGLRFGDGQKTVLSDATQAYCVRPGGCVCPGRSRDSTPATQVESNEVFIGVGPSSGGGPSLAARSLGQWCQEVLVPAPPPNARDQCLVRAWTSRAYVAPGVSGVTQTVRGGTGASLEFRPDRTVTVDMNRTAPAVIALTGPNGTTVTNTIEYEGAGTGTWSAANGVVNVAGVDPSSFRVRLRVESSRQGVLADAELPATDVRLAGIAGLLGTGRYECTAVSLTVTHVVPGVGGEAGFELVPA
jgi:hypothetical protein